MAFMLGSHNGVHCCGTVGDSHPVHYVDLFSPQQSASKLAFAFGLRVHFVDLFSPQQSASKLAFAFGLRKRSQLIAAKRTFTGDSFQNHDAKVRISEQRTKGKRVFLCSFERKFSKHKKIGGDTIYRPLPFRVPLRLSV